MGRRGDRDDIRAVVAGGIGGRRVVVVAVVVARGGDEEAAGVAGGVDGVLEGLRVAAAAPRVVQDGRAHLHGVVDGLDGVGQVAEAVVVEELAGHHLHVPAHPRDARAVVAHRADGARHVGAVARAVHRVVVLVHEVPAVDVVDEAVAVVVDAVAGDLAGVPPHVGVEVGVAVVDARIDDGHDECRARDRMPGLGRIDVGILDAARLPRVVLAPELAEVGVIGDALVLHRPHPVVRLGVLDVGVAPVCLDQPLHVLPRGDFEPIPVDPSELPRPEHLDAGPVPHRVHRIACAARLEAHEQLVGACVRLLGHRRALGRRVAPRLVHPPAGRVGRPPGHDHKDDQARARERRSQRREPQHPDILLRLCPIASSLLIIANGPREIRDSRPSLAALSPPSNARHGFRIRSRASFRSFTSTAASSLTSQGHTSAPPESVAARM